MAWRSIRIARSTALPPALPDGRAARERLAPESRGCPGPESGSLNRPPFPPEVAFCFRRRGVSPSPAASRLCRALESGGGQRLWMSIAGSSFGDAWKTSRSSCTCTSSPKSVGGGTDTIPSLKLCPPGTQPKAERPTTDDVSLGPRRCERPRRVRERPDTFVAVALWGGGRGEADVAVAPRALQPFGPGRKWVGEGRDIFPTVELRPGARRALAGQRSRPESRDGPP